MEGLTREQVDAMLQPIAGARVSKQKDKRTGREQSHVQAYDIKRRLINIFGFGGWSGEVLSMELIGERDTTVGEQQKPGVTVGYRCTYRLTVHATGAVYTETATGDGTMGVSSRWDAHDFAIKTAESQALKRCAINLGDQFGLSLYNNGSLAPLVRYVLGDDMAAWRDGAIYRPGEDNTSAPELNDHVTEPLAPEDPQPEEGSPVPPPAGPDQPSLAAGDDVPATPLLEDVLREEVDVIMATRDERTKSANRAALSKVLVRGQYVRGQMVATNTGEAMSLEAYIQSAIAEVGRA